MKNKSPVGFVLAAGLGNRLRPSTLYCPKPLIPVAGVEPLYFALSQLEKLGNERVIVNAHYLQQMIFQSIEKWKEHFPSLEIRISNETTQLLGTGGAILKVVQENRDWFEGRGLFVQNGDTLSLFDQTPLFENTEKNTFAISLRAEYLERYGPLWLENNQWVGIGREPKDTDWTAAHYLGSHYLSPETIKLIRRFCGDVDAIDLFNGIYRPLKNIGINFSAVPFEIDPTSKNNCWFDITNKEFLLEAQSQIMSHMFDLGWDKLLQKRYPGISEVTKGIWVFNRAMGIEALKMQSPSIFVNTSADEMAVPDMVLGPDACWIQEKPMPQGVSSGTKSSNAIIFLKKETTNDVPSSINGEVLLA